MKCTFPQVKISDNAIRGRGGQVGGPVSRKSQPEADVGAPTRCVTPSVRHSARASQPLRCPTKLDSSKGTPPCVTALVRHSPRASQPLRRPTKLDSPGGAPPCVTALVRHSRSGAPTKLDRLAILLGWFVGCWITGQETRLRRAINKIVNMSRAKNIKNKQLSVSN